MDKISQAAQILRDAKIILIGAGAGLSTAAGYVYGGGCGYYNYETLSQPIASSEKTFSGYVYPYDYQPVGIEATDAAKELFGTERMIDALNAQPDAAPEQLLRNVRAAVDGFVKDAEQFDDLTMLCVEYKGGEKA